jgi:hypothetical protein
MTMSSSLLISLSLKLKPDSQLAKVLKDRLPSGIRPVEVEFANV